MRYAIISDIHGNLPALEQVLAALADERIDQYLCLGDIVGYGASPNECCQLVQQTAAICIRGNHDEAIVRSGKEDWFNAEARACLLWTRQQLTEENRHWLASLEPIAQVGEITLCHGSVPDPDYYTTTAQGALHSFAAMSTSLAFFGHTHYAEWFKYRSDWDLPAQHSHPEGGICQLEQDFQYLINPGAVGQPRDDNPQASFAVYDDEQQQVTIHRLDYDIPAAQQKMFAAGLPPSMALRLALGI